MPWRLKSFRVSTSSQPYNPLAYIVHEQLCSGSCITCFLDMNVHAWAHYLDPNALHLLCHTLGSMILSCSPTKANGDQKLMIHSVAQRLVFHATCRATITGHSLGGALATLCTLFLRLKYPNVYMRCVSIGAPLVGNQQFKQLFDMQVGSLH